MPQVTVESPRERALRRQVAHFVTSVIVKPADDAFDRWSIPICPLVAGLPKAFGELILERISKAAVDAHAPLAGKDCHPDLFVVAHDDVGQLLKTWWARDRTTYNYHGIACRPCRRQPSARMRRLASEPRLARVERRA